MDLVLAYDKNFIYKVSQFTPLAKSDHNILDIQLNVTEKLIKKQIKCCNYNKVNYSILEEYLNEVDWEKEIQLKSLNEYWDMMIKILNKFKDDSIPKFNR